MPRKNRVEKRRVHFSWQAQYLVKLECIFQYKIVFKMGRVRSPKRRVRDDDFMVGLSSESVRIVFLLAEAIQGCLAEILNSEFRGRRSIW